MQLELGAVRDNSGNLGANFFFSLMMQDVTTEGYSPSYFLYPHEALWAARTRALFQYSDLRTHDRREPQAFMPV